MIRSMTAFATAEGESPLGALVVELRSINHRYLEQSLRLPEELRRFEPELRSIVANRLARGKVDVTVRIRATGESAGELIIDHERLDQLASLLLELDTRFPGMRVDATELLAWPGVLQPPIVDDAALQTSLTRLLGVALEQLLAAREQEGAKLKAAIEERLEALSALLDEVWGWLPQIRQGLRDKLKERLAELTVEAEPGRLEQELVLQLNRMDVDEEMDRLRAHVDAAQLALSADGPVGRRLDFLLQEFNREANTLGSKSVDSRTTGAAVELKVLIEQMREQVQNIE